MKHAEWLWGVTVASLVSGCGLSVLGEPSVTTRPISADVRTDVPGHSASPLITPDYLVRPDTGERRILYQLLQELKRCRHLIDNAYTRRDREARLRIDYARLATEFNQIMIGLQRSLTAVDTAPRGHTDITGDYQLYE